MADFGLFYDPDNREDTLVTVDGIDLTDAVLSVQIDADGLSEPSVTLTLMPGSVNVHLPKAALERLIEPGDGCDPTTGRQVDMAAVKRERAKFEMVGGKRVYWKRSESPDPVEWERVHARCRQDAERCLGTHCGDCGDASGPQGHYGRCPSKVRREFL